MSRKEDLTWIIGSASSSFIMLALYFLFIEVFNWPFIIGAGILYAIFLIIFDGTHIFATYTRTYFNTPFFIANKVLLLTSLSVVVVGPLFVLGAYTLGGTETARGAFILLNRFGFAFAYFHVMRQHWGFMSIYRAKNDPRPLRISRRLDGCTLGFGLMTPFIFALQTFKPLHKSELTSLSTINWGLLSTYLIVLALLSLGIKMISTFYQRSDNLTLVINAALIIFSGIAIFLNMALHFGISELLSALLIFSLTGFLISLSFYIWNAILVFNRQGEFNFPKHLFLATVLITHSIILSIDLHPVIYVISITIFHDIQYHKFVHHTNSTQFTHTQRRTHGLVVTMSQKLLVFVVLALIWNLFSTIPRAASNIFISIPLLNYVVSAFFWGYPFHHYLLDSIIWKIGRNPDLQQSLKLNSSVTVT